MKVMISDEVFARLQKLAIPIIDTPETVLSRILDEIEGVGCSLEPTRKTYSAFVPPDLTHTKVTKITCGETTTGLNLRPTWNSLLLSIIRKAKEKAKDTAEFKESLPIPYVDGERTGGGFKHYPDIGLSLQGQDANAAWRMSCRLARRLNIPVRVEFTWRYKEGAAFPGENGELSVG